MSIACSPVATLGRSQSSAIASRRTPPALSTPRSRHLFINTIRPLQASNVVPRTTRARASAQTLVRVPPLAPDRAHAHAPAHAHAHALALALTLSPQDSGALVFVAGATGGVGQLVCAKLLAKGYRVRALSRDAAKATASLSSKLTPEQAARLEVVVGDLKTPADIPKLIGTS